MPSKVTYNTLLSAAARARDWPRAQLAWTALCEAPAVAANEISYNARLSAAARAGRVDAAASIVAEMRAKGLPRDVFTYATLVRACEEDWERALEVRRPIPYMDPITAGRIHPRQSVAAWSA